MPPVTSTPAPQAYMPFEQLVISTEVEGDTGTPSQIKVLLQKNNVDANENFVCRFRICDEDGWANASNATIAPVAGKGDIVITNSSTKDIEVESEPGTQATGVLTISGVVIDGETVTIGGRVYEFDTNGSTTGDVAVDIASDATAAAGTLTVDTQPTAGDTMTIGGRTYSFVADGTANFDGEISIGADLAGAKTAIVAAINGTDGWNVAHPTVTAAAFSGDDSVITAKTPGTAGDAIDTTETFTAVTNIFDDTTLGTTAAGADCSAADAVTALAAAIEGDGSAVVGAADGAGDTVDVTADTAGAAGNSIGTTETMANGAFGAVNLENGNDALDGEIWIEVTNATAETVTLRVAPSTFNSRNCDYSADKVNVTHAAP